MNCKAKHTNPSNVSNEDFVCLECGAKCGDFYKDDTEYSDCDLLHPSDYLRCMKCDAGCDGTYFIKWWKKEQEKKNLVVEKCSHCEGKGYNLRKIVE